MADPASFPPGYWEEDNGPRAIAAATTMLVLTTLLFSLRLYARTLTTAQRGWDDHVLIPAYIGLLGLIVAIYIEVIYAGLGKHTVVNLTEDPSRLKTYLLWLYILDWFYVPSNMLSRVSVVILYLRIFTDKWARAACWIVMSFLIGNCVATIITAQFECTPLAYTWDKSIEGGTCFNQLLWYQISNFPNIAADVMIMILPIKTVWSLKASTARKAGVATVCLTGSIGLIASCYRASVFYNQAYIIANDPTFTDAGFSWTAIECGLYFSAACLIGMRPLFNRLPTLFKARVFRTTNRSGVNTDQHGSMSRINKHRISEYATIQGDDEVDRKGAGGISLQTMIPSAYHSPNLSSGDQKSDNIRVDTDIQVTRDFVQNYP